MLRLLHRLTLSLLPTVLLISDVSAIDAVNFDRDIRPIFAEHCVACHGGVKQASGLSLIYADNVFSGGDSGAPAVVPGDVAASYLIERVTEPDPDLRMPPADHGPALTEEEVSKLRQWISDGAKWEPPWAFVVPKRPPVPELNHSGQPRSPIDYFIMSRLQSAGLKPSPAADREEWLRRVSFDLTGLPPTPEEIDNFISDSRPDAFEQVVDRLLASPHFGERWAAMWLDLARYADTTGYEKDPHRDIWPYRDWVIRALNADMPFDQFTIRQLAGDLLENPTLDDLIATAFHRNTQTNTEGGTDDEEFRLSAVIDRVNTTWQVWQATTFGCTQCHSHPYEAIRHDEYYQFLAFLNNTRDSDVDEDLPRIDVPRSYADHTRMRELLSRQSTLKRYLHEIVTPLANEPDTWHNLPIDEAKSSGNTVLRIHKGKETQTELHVEGAATMGSKFTIESPLPENLTEIAALRIDALLRDADAARKNPDVGFVLSHINAYVTSSDDAKPQQLEFAYVFSDEPEPVLDPNDSLDEDAVGWGSYTRQWYPQYAIFLLKKPIPLSRGARIHIELAQNRGATGDIALVLNRSTYSVSGDGEWFRLQESTGFREAQLELTDLQREREKIPSISIPTLQELDVPRMRSTYVFERGLWLDKGTEVHAGVPAIFGAQLSGRPNRLEMARWLVSNENPLTARVIVNRIWAELFGRGIVETVDDFGVSGTLPSHPELLDYLAVTFRDDYQWSIKLLLKEIALSSTYRQTARRDPASNGDPDNRMLSRGPRERLSAEMVRDQALVLSGKFSAKQFGPPVMPPQPDGVWRSVYNGAKWETASGEDRYRRAIYTFWKRTSGYPAMLTFDMPSREVCSGQRVATNTPLQALVTLNDDGFFELAEGFATRMLEEGGKTLEDQISWGYRVATSANPDPQVVDRLHSLYKKALEEYRGDIGGQDHAKAEKQALVIVASTIMNLDEALTK